MRSRIPSPVDASSIPRARRTSRRVRSPSTVIAAHARSASSSSSRDRRRCRQCVNPPPSRRRLARRVATHTTRRPSTSSRAACVTIVVVSSSSSSVAHRAPPTHHMMNECERVAISRRGVVRRRYESCVAASVARVQPLRVVVVTSPPREVVASRPRARVRENIHSFIHSPTRADVVVVSSADGRDGVDVDVAVRAIARSRARASRRGRSRGLTRASSFRTGRRRRLPRTRRR
jgi:hypothetical protein